MNAESRKLSVCGCGTVGDALDAAFRVVAAEKDCYHWHTTVDNLVMIIRGNLLARTLVAEGVCTKETAQDHINTLNVKEADRSSKMADENGEQIAEWCDALFEKDQQGVTQ